MASYASLCRAARKMGHELTPSLKADLRKMADISDEEIRVNLRKQFVSDMARKFQVTESLMEMRLEGVGPHLPPSPTTDREE